LPFVSQGSDDPANIANEAQVEHAISLVQHELADLVQLQLVGGHQVADTTRRADDDIDPPRMRCTWANRLTPPRMATIRSGSWPARRRRLSSICNATRGLAPE
jgi:hypothetical protein